MNLKLRNICFTVYNYDTTDSNWKVRIYNGLKITYLIYGEEICPKTQRKHLQAYAEFESQHTWNKIQKVLNPICFFPCKGTQQENINYCKKDNKYKEEGSPKLQGARTDLNELKDNLLNDNVSVDDIVVERPELYHQYGRTLHKIEDLKLRKKFRTTMTECDWIYGPTGSGKSHMAFHNYTPETHYVWKYETSGWQDGYTGQDYVIINDFRGQIPYGELLNLIDKWPYTLNRRGREPVPFLAKKIFITAPVKPEEIYKNLSKNDSLEQLYRRINLIFLGTPEISQKCSEGNINSSEHSPHARPRTDELQDETLNIKKNGKVKIIY